MSSCTQMGLFLANVPAKFANHQIEKNIAYGDDSWQKLDIYIPQTKNDVQLPVIVFFYGGSWEDGSKEMYPFIAKNFTDKGYITVIADYGKYPTIKFPTFVEDGAEAVAWVYNNIEQYGGDNNQFYLAGHSAGAYIAAMVATNKAYLASQQLNTRIINGFSGLAGPYDFAPNTQRLKAIFSEVKDDYTQMQVSSFVEGDEPPMLLIWGEQDKLVYRRNIELFSNKIKDKNGQVETILYKDMDHVDMVKNMMWMVPSDESILEEMSTFFSKTQSSEKLNY